LSRIKLRARRAFIDFIGLLYHDNCSEDKHKTKVGWRLDRSYWGWGLATEGALANLRYRFEEIELERVISIRLPQNLASRRVR